MALLIGKQSIDANFAIREGADAGKGLQELSNHYSLRDGTLKPGTLRLVKNWDGTIQLKRTQWYHFWNSSLFGTRDTSRAETYVKSLLKKLETGNPIQLEGVQYKEYTIRSDALEDFLNPTKEKGPVTTEGLSKLLSLRHKINVESSSKINDAITKCLDEEGITLHGKIGAGGMGFVYGAEVDFYSTGMLLLEMIDFKSFNDVLKGARNLEAKGFFINKRIKELKDQPTKTLNYLNEYLKAASANSTVSQKLQLEENKSVKTLIDLCFEASKGGVSGKAAFEQWKTAFQTWKQNNSSVLLA